jgi:hypothetical protein
MDEAERMRTAVNACERVLGRGRRRSVRDRLLMLLDSEYDLVNADSPDLLRILEERVAVLLGKPAAAFFPTGTMAQQVALRCWAERTGNRTVALHPLAHPEQYERNALSTLAGLRTVHLTKAPRPFTAAEVTALDEPFGTLMAELPLRNAGFLLPYGTEALQQAALRQAEQGTTSLFWGWTETELPGVSKTEVTVSAAGLEWTAADVEAAVREFVSYLPVLQPETAPAVSLG